MAIKALNSVAGFSVGQVPTAVILANGDVSTNNIVVSNYANLGDVANIYIGGGNGGAVLSTDGTGNLSWTSAPSVTEIHNGNSNVTLPDLNGNVYINANNGTDQRWVFDTNGILTLATPTSGYSQITSNSGANIDIYTGGTNYSEIYLIDGGNVTIATQGELYNWVFDNTGNTLFPAVGSANLGNLVTANYANFINDLVVGGNANVTGNVSASNFSTTGSAGNISGANVIFANSFTSNGGLVDFSTNNANVQLGSNANVHIYGGNTGQILQTDGNGNLSWVSTGTQSEIFNGNSNVQIVDPNGNVYINANNGTDQQWNFTNSGNLVLPSGGVITEGSSPLGAGNTISLTPFGGNNVNQQLLIYPTITEGDHLHLTTGNLAVTSLFLGNDIQYIRTNTAGAMVIGTNDTYPDTPGYGNRWTFDTVGNLTTPDNSYIKANSGSLNLTDGTGNSYVQLDTNNVYLYTDYHGSEYEWNFDSTGNTTFPATGTANLGNVAIANSFTAGPGTGTVDFNTYSPNVQLGSNANVHLYGGNAGQVLQTDGNGNLNWYSISATEIVNGNSNVSIPDNNGNIYAYTNGTNEWIYDTTGNTTFPSSGTANLGNLVTANYANFANDANVQGNLEVVGNIQTGGGSGGNISGVDTLFADYANITNDVNAGNTVTANYFYANANANIAGNLTVQSDATVTGNLTVGNLLGKLANGTSNVAIPAVNGNINLSVGGNANVLTVTSTGANVIGTAYANGNITTTSTFVGNAITSNGTYLRIASDYDANGTYNINLVPGGAGNVDVNSTYITSLADPINPQDAATKQYVDSTAQGLFIHTAANVLASSNLNATYTSGGTTLTVTAIIGTNTIQFSTNHGLSANADISFTNAFNGLNGAPDVYWVDTIPASNQITLKETYFGPIVNNLTAGTGLSQPALAQSGVGATLTNAGTQAALSIDSVTLTTGQRVLVNGQTNEAYNGIYDVTTVGTGSTNWVLTRSSDGDTFVPQSPSALCAGSYFFISQGSTYAGSSWVLQSTGEIDIGTTNITFTQFGQAGAYTGANGIAITGTIISANVDNVTTAIVGGNITVAVSAQLTTPNIGDATGTSLSVSGNVQAGNINSSSSTITDSLTVNTSANANTFTSTNWANIGTDLIVGGNANISGNVQIGTGSGGNISGVNYINANVANITTDAIIGGNANITGNLTANSSFLGETSITGNANVTANILANSITSNVDITTTAGNANIAGNVLANYVASNNDFTTTNGNFVTTNGNLVATTGYVNANNANISNVIELGNTVINWATLTTNTITANQAIAQYSVTGVTGIEFLVKGIDSLGAKYSVATVQAVTDGANVDYSIYGGVQLGAYTGSLSVAISGSNVVLQVTPASSNSTVWTTQYRII